MIWVMRPILFTQSAPVGNGPASQLCNAVNKSAYLHDYHAALDGIGKVILRTQHPVVDAKRVS